MLYSISPGVTVQIKQGFLEKTGKKVTYLHVTRLSSLHFAIDRVLWM